MTTERMISAVFRAEEDTLQAAGLKLSGESIRIIGVLDEPPIMQVKGNAEYVHRLLSYVICTLMEKGVEAGVDPEEAKSWARQIAEDAVEIFKLPED